MWDSKKVESASHHSRQLKRDLKKDYITHEDANNPEAISLSNAKEEGEPMNVVENIVDLINTSENDEKSLIDFESTSFSHAYTQTNVTIDFIDLQEKEFITTNLTVFKLQKEITLLQPGTREWFASNEKVKFFTGLPNVEIFDALFIYISDSITSSSRSALTKYQMVSLTLMRLRLNLMINNLAYRFNVSSSTASSASLEVNWCIIFALETSN